MTTTTQNNKMTGQTLLDYVETNQTLSRVEMCEGAGYERNFTEFYEAILDARKANGEYQTIDSTVNGRDWYEDILTDEGRELYDKIEDMCPEFSKLDAEQCQEFMDELSDLGITTAEQFEDAYYYQTDSHKAEAEFAEYFTTEINCVQLPESVVIDWQDTWDSMTSYDFSTIEFDGTTYFISNNY